MKKTKISLVACIILATNLYSNETTKLDEITISSATKSEQKLRDVTANVDVIKATIIVQKDSQKGMIIGKGATAIKRIGKAARAKIEELSGQKCYLELFVSVKKNWTKNKEALKNLGYDIDAK